MNWKETYLGVLFVFVGSLAAFRYMSGDVIGAGAGLVASLVVAAVFVRAVIVNQPMRSVVFEGALAAAAGVLGILIAWLYAAWIAQ
jgi:hypothetical protein